MTRLFLGVVRGLLLLLTFAHSAVAANDIWDGNGASPPNGIWGTGNNWADNTTPTAADTATFNLANTYTVTVNAAPAAIQALTNSAGNVTLTSSGGAKTLNVNSGGLLDFTVNGGATMSLGTTSNPMHVNVADDLVVNGNGTLNIRNGSQVTTVDLLLGNTSGTSGSIIVDGAGSALNRTGTGNIGSGGGSAVLIFQNNATGNFDGTLALYNSPLGGSSGAISVESGADLEIDTANIGTSGIGPGGFGSMTVTGLGSTITQSGASALTVGRATAGGNLGILNVNSAGVFTTGTGAVTVNTTGTVNIGGGTLNANGTFTMSSGSNVTVNGGALKANAGFVNSAGGTLNLSNGELSVGGGLFVPNAAGTLVIDAPNSVNLPHLRLTNNVQFATNSAVIVGSVNHGKLTIEGGADVNAGSLHDVLIGNLATGEGEVLVTGAGTHLSNVVSLEVGTRGTGQLSISNGALVNSALTLVGKVGGVGASGTLIVDGGNLQSGGLLSVGHEATGVAHIINGGFAASSDGLLGNTSGSQGIVNVSGPSSRWVISDDLDVGVSGAGTLNIGAGGEVFVFDNISVNAGSSINLNGGKLRIHTLSNANRVFYNSGTIALSGNRTAIDPLVSAFFGIEIPANKGLEIEGSFIADGGLVVDGGTLEVGGGFSVGNQLHGFLQVVNGGTVSSGASGIGSNYPTYLDSEGHVLVRGEGSKWTIGDFLIVGSDLVVDPDDASSLTIEDQGMVDIDGPLAIGNESFVTLNGGTLRFDFINRDSPTPGLPNGKFNFYTGTIQMTGDRALGADSTINELFNGVIAAGKNLTVEGMASTITAMAVDGGILTVGSLGNAQLLQLQRGTLHVLDGVLTVGAAGQLGATLDVNDDMTVVVEDGFVNQGLVTGDGQIGGGSFANVSTGELRGEPGKSLKITGANNTNSGRINLLGGLVEFTQNLTNTGSVSALISGNGTLIARTGLTNNGTMNFAGTANIVGDVTNSVGGRIISGGGGATIFYDDVVNSGEIRTSTNGFSVFFGSVSGSGSFTGTGTVNFEGDLSPGSSPATVNFGGDVVLGPAATLAIELGGTAPGTYDRLDVAGDLVLDGLLAVSILPGFSPTAGQSFNVLDWDGALSGNFSETVFPTLAGLTWNTSQLYTNGIISLAAAGLAGDYNADGIVDAVDYTVWRNNLGDANEADLNNNGDGGAVTESDFTWWKSHYGSTSPGSGGFAENASQPVPEPATISWMTLVVAAYFVAMRRWMKYRPSASFPSRDYRAAQAIKFR